MTEHKGGRGKKKGGSCLPSQYEKVEMLNNQKGKKGRAFVIGKRKGRRETSTVTTQTHVRRGQKDVSSDRPYGQR